MNDIDFDALDQAISSAMSNKPVVKNPQPVKNKISRNSGKSMDFLPKNEAKIARKQVSIKQKVSPKQAKIRKNSAVSKTIEDIFRPTKPAKTARPKQVVRNKVQPAKKPAPAKTSSTTENVTDSLIPVDKMPESVNLNHLRHKRRLHQPAVINQHFVSADGQVVGHYQSQTISKHTKDGDYTYRKDKLDYVAKPATDNSVTVNQKLNSKSSNVKTVAPVEVLKPVQVKKNVKPVRLNHNKSANEVVEEKNSSPFLETVKVEKRPLGVPEQKFKPTNTITHDYRTAPKQEKVKDVDLDSNQPVLYRNDHKLAVEQEETKKPSKIWLFLVILLFAIGVGLFVYWFVMYNN